MNKFMVKNPQREMECKLNSWLSIIHGIISTIYATQVGVFDHPCLLVPHPTSSYPPRRVSNPNIQVGFRGLHKYLLSFPGLMLRRV